MADEELIKWNLRFCPKCIGCIQISYRRKKEGGIEIIKHCQNLYSCDSRAVLTKEKITDNDRHKIAEPFLKWFVLETSRYVALEHNNLPVSSPYCTIDNKLGHYLSDNFEKELKKIIKTKKTLRMTSF